MIIVRFNTGFSVKFKNAVESNCSSDGHIKLYDLHGKLLAICPPDALIDCSEGEVIRVGFPVSS